MTFMNKIEKQINQELEQYQLAVQNNELKSQIGIAKDTITYQNQHITELYSAMTLLIGILTLIVAVFGIAVPLWTAKKSKDIEKELKDNIARIDDFITNKFQEWENQDLDKALDRYIRGELSWIGYHTILKWKPMPFEHMKKICDFINVYYKQPLSDCRELLSPLAYYLFIEHKNSTTDDFQKGRELIINSDYLYVLALESSKTYIEILKEINEKKRNEKILDLLEQSDNIPLYNAVDAIIDGDFLSSKINEIIAKKIIKRKDYCSLKIVENTQSIIDILKKEKLFDEVESIYPPRGNDMQINLWNTAFQINKDSCLAKELQTYKAANEQQ